MTINEVVADASAPTEPDSLWRRPPGRLFHVLLVLPALAWLWSWSVPGFNFLLWMPSMLVLGVGVLIWGVRLVTYVRARVRGQPASGGRWFVAAPICGAAALCLIFADVPLEMRWALSRGEFEDVVDEAPEDGGYRSLEDERLGLYSVMHVYRQDDAVIFYEQTGNLFDDAGFAYLPNGPFTELENGGFERPQFRHLGGPWYAWTASW